MPVRILPGSPTINYPPYENLPAATSRLAFLVRINPWKVSNRLFVNPDVINQSRVLMAYAYFLFDIDGTLVRSAGVGWRSIRESCREVLGDEPLPQIELAGRTDHGIFMELLEHWQLPAAPWLDRLVAAYHRHLAANWNPTAFEVLPGVRALVEQIADSDWAIPGLLTGNSPIGAETKLSRADLWDFFRLGFYGDRDRCRNELARRVPPTLRDANPDCDNLNIVIIGDTIADIACARAINATVIAVATGYSSWESLQSAEPDYLVDDLRQISLEEFREPLD